MTDEQPQTLSGQPCPMCNKKTLTLMESKRDIPYFGKVYLFSMSCSECKYHKADVELAEQNDPCKCSFDVETEEDLKVRVVKSGEATVKIPRIMNIEPGPASNGYVTNIEGILNRVKHMLESTRDSEEDADARKKAKNMLKKVDKVLWGSETIRIIIEDPTGNSGIVSEKTKVEKLK